MSHWEQVWQFSTARFQIVGEVTDCEDNPNDHFEFPEDIEAVRSGRVAWFDARVRVLAKDDGTELGADYLSCCAYDRPEMLFRHHASLIKDLQRHTRRHASALDLAERLIARGSRGWRGWRGQVTRELDTAAAERQIIARLRAQLANNISVKETNVVYAEYGPSLVREAVREARHTLARMSDLAGTMRQSA